MFKLGIKPYGHDTGAALVKDGKIIAVASEERFNRKKHSSKLPRLSIKFCLKEAGITDINDIDEISTGFDYWKLIYHLYIKGIPRFLPFNIDVPIRNSRYHVKKISSIYKLLRDEFGYKGKITFLDHHDCHASTVYYTSPYEEATILTIDGRGENASTRIYSANEQGFKIKFQQNYPDSLGVLYTAITEYLGFLGNCDEGKVMGLASYGSLRYVERMRKVVKITNQGYSLDLTYFDMSKSPSIYVSDKFHELFGPKREKKSPITTRHEDIAKALQTILEEAILALSKKANELTGYEKLCFTGGVALNSVANGKLIKSNIFEDIYLYPASGDDGISIGAALHSYYRKGKKKIFIESNRSPYKGYESNDEEIKQALETHKLRYKKVDNVCKEGALLLADNYCIGWYQGKAELGPRALGNRSILIDPRNPGNKDLINSKIKFRESFRPFAPSVLEEKSKEYFDLPNSFSPYMLLAVDVNPAKRNIIPAVTHVDGTARVQTVNRKFNSRYWELIHEFYKITGVPVVLNTSFNRMGEPIVNTPEDAIKCFLDSGLDVLILKNYIVKK